MLEEEPILFACENASNSIGQNQHLFELKSSFDRIDQ